MADRKLHFKRIDEPSEIITDIASSYRKQNILSQKIRMLYNSFDGIKLGNWEYKNTLLPYIMAGSIIEFDGAIYETQNNIFFTDDISNGYKDKRFLRVHRFIQDNQYYLEVELKQTSTYTDMYVYNYIRRGFYYSDSKDLRVRFRYDRGSYVDKNLWDINDTNRYGSALSKKNSVYDSPGTYTFDFPINSNSIEILLVGPGGGGGSLANNVSGGYPTDGTESKILIGSKLLTTCFGGKAGGESVFAKPGDGGIGGVATGLGLLYKGGDGTRGVPGSRYGAPGGRPDTDMSTYGKGYGGSGGAWGSTVGNGGGGGAGAIAIITITRDMLDITKKITVIVGEGGKPGTRGYNATEWAKAGENGLCYITYYERVISA